MKIEEAEAIFGKRWNQWTEEENREFASVLQADELVYPIYLNFGMKYFDILPLETQLYLGGLIAESNQRKGTA